MFHVAMRSTAPPFFGASTGMGGHIGAVHVVLSPQPPAQRPADADDHQNDHTEYREGHRPRMTDRLDGAIDEHRGEGDTWRESDHGPQQIIAPADMRGAGDDIDDRERR